MDRTNATNYVIEGGKRRYNNGIPQTIIAPNQMNALENEITNVIEKAGITPDINNWEQLYLAILALVPTPSQQVWPVFEAMLSANQSWAGDDVLTKINYTLEIVDTNNNYDATQARFTPTVTGFYSFTIQAFATCGVELYGGSLSLFKNGYQIRNSNMPGAFIANSKRGHTFTCISYANGTTDYFEAYVSMNGEGVNPTITMLKQAESYAVPITIWSGYRVN